MRISQLNLVGLGNWPDLHISELSTQLNVFFSGPRGGKSTLARLVSHLLYGKSGNPWHQPFGQYALPAEGEVTLQSAGRSYFLKRRAEASNQYTLTVAATDGAPVDGRTVQALLGDISPRLAAQLFAIDFAEPPRCETLLSDPFAREFTANLPRAVPTESVDRQRIEELVQQRHAIAQQLEQHVKVGRREATVLEQQASNLDESLSAKREQLETLQSRLRAIETKLTELAVRLRHSSLESRTNEHGHHLAIRDKAELGDLDSRIARCRKVLSELQTRSASVQAELAQAGPDGAADSVTCLTDGRVTLGLVERLLNDLDAEVAQLARADVSVRPIGADAHARFTPLANMLRQQLYTLCGQWTEQERRTRRQQLLAESKQISRAQADIGEWLEQLLARRESLVQQALSTSRPVILSPQPPVIEYCQCEHHQQFVGSSESVSPEEVEQLQSEQARLRHERTRLLDELAVLSREISRIETTWSELQQERAGLIGGATIEAKRAELDRLESILQKALSVKVHDPGRRAAKNWLASDVLAQLTDGQLVQIRLKREAAAASVVDNEGRSLSPEQLSPAQRDQLYLALTLALVSSYASRSIRLPLILDEPFLRLDEAASGVMAGVLEEFARAGHQLLIFTEDHCARRTLESHSRRVFDLDKERYSGGSPSPEPPITTTRLVRETLDGQQTAGLRLATGHVEGDIEAVFYLSVASSLNEFPILGSKTGQIFARLGIHSVGDLLEANPQQLADRLNRNDVRTETVALWQSHMSLLCHVPELTLNDAQLLTACGIGSPVELREANGDQLWSAVESFLSTSKARCLASDGKRYNRARIGEWIYAAGGVDKTRQQAGRSPHRVIEPAHAHHDRKQVFHLDLNSDVEAAPAIGPKTAERLHQVGIRTVADLLSADPESTAEELDAKHIRPKMIANWQHQARLVCQIPELHGYGAQLLVACGFTRPEQIAKYDTNELTTKVLKLCRTKQGQRILRSVNPPSPGRIQRWAQRARDSRSLEVA